MNQTIKINSEEAFQKFEMLIENNQNKLVRHAFFRLGNMQDAEDVVQDIFIKMFAAGDQFRLISNHAAYIFKMVSNACIDKQRVSANKQTIEISETTQLKNPSVPDVSESLIQHEEFARINCLLSKIPEEQSEILRFRIIDEMSFVDIAELLELPVTTVKSRFKYGIDKMKMFYKSTEEVKNEL